MAPPIGLSQGPLPALLRQLAPEPREGPCGAFQLATARQTLASSGESLGWEVLGFDRASCHSWLCNSLHIAAAERLGVGLGKFGLLDSETRGDSAGPALSGRAS